MYLTQNRKQDLAFYLGGPEYPSAPLNSPLGIISENVKFTIYTL